MFCFCLQNSLLKLQALETDLCSAFLPTQEETPQLPAPKDPAPSSVQTSVQADGASSGGKGSCHDVLSFAIIKQPCDLQSDLRFAVLWETVPSWSKAPFSDANANVKRGDTC